MFTILLLKFPWLKYWRVGLFAAFMIFTLWLLWFVNDKAYDRGYAVKSLEYEAALKEAETKARSQIAGMEKGYDKTSKDFESLPSGGAVGSASAYSLEWLRSHYSDSE